MLKGHGQYFSQKLFCYTVVVFHCHMHVNKAYLRHVFVYVLDVEVKIQV